MVKNNWAEYSLEKKKEKSWMPLAVTYKPLQSGGRDEEHYHSKLAQANKSQGHILNIPSTIMGWGSSSSDNHLFGKCEALCSNQSTTKKKEYA
jgi:hypothetical protein